MEVESQISGILRKILVNEGKSIPVTLPIAIIGDKDEDISKMIEEAYQKLRKSETVAIKEISLILAEKQEVESKEQEKEFKNISPGAKRKAKELGVEFQSLKGSGPGGIVIEKDVIDYFQLKENKSKNLTMKKEAEKRLPYTGIRKIIGDRLSQSKYTIPHVYFTIAVDVTKAIRFLQSYNTDSKLKITMNDFIVFVVAKVLLEQTSMNCSLINEEIIYHKDINIGIAVALEEGLIVPVVKKANKKDLSSLSQEIKKIIKLARDRKLMPDDYKGGTFTVSNLGMYGVDNFIAIINPPEAAILAIGAIRKAPVVVGKENKEEIKIHSIMQISLSVDHRLIDGIVAAKFLNRVKFYLEFPESLIL